ncbi:MAG: ANTAR domain-containing protein [Anaeroplasmataceae bacterium]
MKISILINDTNLKYKYNSIINKAVYKISFTELNDIDSNLLKIDADIIIAHHSYIKSNYKILDKLVMLNKFQIIYVSNGHDDGLLYNLIFNKNFLLLYDHNIESINQFISLQLKYFKQTDLLENKIYTLEDKLKEESIIKKAKLHLMNIKKITEEEAYKLIQKSAMQNNTTKLNISKKILNI